MEFGAESLLPPVVAIVCAIATRRVVLPLAAGVLVGSALLIHADPNASWWQLPEHYVTQFLKTIDPRDPDTGIPHLQAIAFSLLLGAMVGVIESGGGMRSLITRLSRRVKSRRGAQTLVSTTGLIVFFDDYANTLLLGGTMRTTADRYRVSREKLAYLVDSTAAPVAGLALISTWTAIEISYINNGLRAGGIDDPTLALQLFFQSIPYRFYPWLALAMVFMISLSGRDFGPMRKAEEVASRREPSEPDRSAHESPSESRPLWLAAVIPVASCVVAVLTVLARTGWSALDDLSPDAGLLESAGQVFGNGQSYVALIVGGGVGVVTAIGSHLALGGCDFRSAIWFAFKGARHMLLAIVMLWFAWALSALTEPDQLDTGGYLARVLNDRLAAELLPSTVFLVSGAVAFSTGTSWGTMAILTPLSISLALSLEPTSDPHGAVVLATCGSVLAGSIFGDHCSPISDTTVLSSQSSGCDHVAHVRTQMPYSVVVALICVVGGTLPAAFGVPPWVSLLLGAIALYVVIRLVGREVEPVTESAA